MDNSVSKNAFTAAVDVYVGSGISCQVTREQAREMRDAGTHYFINHGKALRSAIPQSPRTELEEALDWNMPFGRMRASALNEGRSGQFFIGYPIPYVFEGRPLNMKVSVVNAGDPVHQPQDSTMAVATVE